MQISIMMLIFLLFWDQLSGGEQRFLRGEGQTASGGRPRVEKSNQYTGKYPNFRSIKFGRVPFSTTFQKLGSVAANLHNIIFDCVI